MAEDHGAAHDEVADSTALPVVNIAAANSGLLDANTDIVFIPEFGDWAVLNGDFFDVLEDECWVLREFNMICVGAEEGKDLLFRLLS